MPKKKEKIDDLREYIAETGRQIREFMRAVQEDDRKVLKRIEDVEAARGRAIESMFRKSLPLALEKAGLHVDYVEPRRLRKDDREYDFIARNGKANFVAEIKARFRARDLAQLRSALVKFREDYPEKAGNRPVYGIVCGQVVDEDAANIARKEGLLVVEGKHEAETLFKPRKMRDYAVYAAAMQTIRQGGKAGKSGKGG